MAAGWDKDRLIEAMRTSLTEIPGVDYNFSQPIKDNVEEAVSGVRGQVVLKVFGTDLDVMKATLEKCLASLKKVSGVVDLDLYRDASIPQLQIVLDRAALARAGINVGAAQDVVRTALGGDVPTEYWQNERPVPCVSSSRSTNATMKSGSATFWCRRPTAATCRCARLRASKTAPAARDQRESNSRVLALKFNIEGRDMGSVVADAMASGQAGGPGARRKLSRVGRRVREPEARDGRSRSSSRSRSWSSSRCCIPRSDR
jgi:cobalt-zinc-cadmium resistance protein CzcA